MWRRAMQSPDRKKNAGRGAVRVLKLAFAVALAVASGAAQAALSCASLASITPDASTISSAAVTPAGTVNGQAVAVPFCRVQGVARPTSDSEIKWEVWLP